MTCLSCSGTGTVTFLSDGKWIGKSCPVCGGSGFFSAKTKQVSADKFAFESVSVVKSIGELLIKTLNNLSHIFTKDISTEKFLEAAAEGNVGVVKRYQYQPSSNINIADPETGFTAIHLAAATNAIDVAHSLMSDSRLDVLLRTRDGRLPSSLAFSIAKNDTLGDKLVELEAAQRHERNVPFHPEV